ncbi:hypothetical protein MBM_01051 [Drepanopeziza brunnea f. sp. 'multigermtubi' MB_m1]|uniref:Uncharacterized protein n=1 Tax=Marssonina brunnea f. sp. multigermtubi (strain MB_m1) TaxID=1072389 RepID=K1Y5B5_MARBU|nr:uncharacterized protein MBM_01051 [Drepanopeziza brunnea f. sp. 'multigermtubi' MB_m1]EKD20369.1 hypothetical protein MBM_01051 [Drepanopeziza brunnea f. sp. 'multigermtubi' MB_m1]
MPSNWFPTGTGENGWRLDIVSLLAVIGESSIEDQSQTLTASWTCMLPRIIPAPQVLLKSSRPTRMPCHNAAVVGVHNGTLVPTLNYFPNIMHPIEDLTPFVFKVLQITHRKKKEPTMSVNSDESRSNNSPASLDLGMIENGPLTPLERRTAKKLTHATKLDRGKPRVPPQRFSPLKILSVGSFFVTVGLIIGAAFLKDGTAIAAVCTISMVSSIVGYASWWQPVLMKRSFKSRVPDGDVVIRTREGAFLLVRCNEDVARELYTGTEECQYHVGTRMYRMYVGFGTFLLMASVVLMGNCEFAMQAAIGLSYIILNGLFWAASLIPDDVFWDLSNYECKDITPPDAQEADRPQDDTLEGRPSFTRTVWYAIRETKKIGWITRGGVAPKTDQWDAWLREAERNAILGNRAWNAVEMREKMVGQAELPVQNKHDLAEQHVPAMEVPITEKR